MVAAGGLALDQDDVEPDDDGGAEPVADAVVEGAVVVAVEVESVFFSALAFSPLAAGFSESRAFFLASEG